MKCFVSFDKQRKNLKECVFQLDRSRQNRLQTGLELACYAVIKMCAELSSFWGKENLIFKERRMVKRSSMPLATTAS